MNSKHWDYSEIGTAQSMGYINGYENNTFKPDEYITRQEVAKIITNITKISGDGKLNFADNHLVAQWAKSSVDAVSDKGIMTGKEGNKFAPTTNITRAEVVTTLSRVQK